MTRASTRQALIGLGGILVVLVGIAALSSRAGRETGLRADILSARRAEPGAEVVVTVSVRDTHGRVTDVEVDFGDGRVETIELVGERCGRPLTRSFDLTHRFEFTGYTTVAARVSTGGCGAKTETAEPIRTIHVKRVRR